MKFLSFNARGVGGAHKLLTLKQLILSHRPDVILIQKTMIEGARERSLFETFLKSCSFCMVDADGLSGGLLTSWSHAYKSILTSSLGSTIIVIYTVSV
jgi:NAD(P)H-hydrate repair Nnr-like enzyme with NAD(P)H-hydrate dehydratase domain